MRKLLLSLCLAVLLAATSYSQTTYTKGTGSPESVLTAPIGSVYIRTDGGTSTTLYVKESGTGNTGWVGHGAPGGSGANTALSNLASVAINTTLVSDTDNTDDLGTSAIRWKNLYLSGFIGDGAGNELLKFSSVASAVNELTVKNAITAKPPEIAATGGDTNIDIYINAKGTGVGRGQILANPMGRYDQPSYSFYEASGAFKPYGMGINGGGGWVSITGANLALQCGDGAQGICALPGLGILAWGEQNSTPIDCPQCEVIGLKKAGRFTIAVVASSSTTPDDTFPNAGTFSFPNSSPAAISADQNNYNPGLFSKFQRWSATGASRHVEGILMSSTVNSTTVTQQDGQEHVICNVGSQDIVLIHQSVVGGVTAANKIISTTGANITLTPDTCAGIIYDSTTSRWRAWILQ